MAEPERAGAEDRSAPETEARSGMARMSPGQAALCGRRLFSAALEAPPRGRLRRTAVLLRLDAFEVLEQRIGHIEAQEVAAQLAEMIQGRLTPQDDLFVFSTDELALLLQRPDYGAAEQAAQLLHKEVSHHIFSTRQHEAHIKLTIAAYPLGRRETPEQIIRQLADETRKISAQGGNRVVTIGATAKANQVKREEARRVLQVRKALEENRFKLIYQSIASLEGESRSHYDVLLHMIDESGSEQCAAEFLPAAQKCNMMRSIDRWVVRHALEAIAERAASEEASVLFVKLSEDTLQDSTGFIGWLRELVQGQPLNSNQIVFEIQETALRSHVLMAKVLTDALRGMGAGLAVEHYGIDANSAELLDEIPADFVKFHTSFARNLCDKEIQKQLSQLVDAAKQHNLKTIVSHVEEAQVTARLWQMGINFVQGHHVQEPEVVLLSADNLGYRTEACRA